jgi:hypothetical protein
VRALNIFLPRGVAIWRHFGRLRICASQDVTCARRARKYLERIAPKSLHNAAPSALQR